MDGSTAVDARDELWNLEGAAYMVAEVRYPRGTPEEWAQEMVCRRPADAAEWRRSIVHGAQGRERALSALEFARHLVARDAQVSIDAAVMASRLQLFDPITNRPTDEPAGAFVLRSDVMSLLEAPSKPGAQGARRAAQSTVKPKRATAPRSPKSPPQTAAGVRWDHLQEFRAAAVEAARSKSFSSRAEAAKHAAEQLQPKPKSKSKPTGPDSYYPWTKVDEWLKQAGWTAKMTWDDWVALVETPAKD